jgi:hypothetical protein
LHGKDPVLASDPDAAAPDAAPEPLEDAEPPPGARVPVEHAARVQARTTRAGRKTIREVMSTS